MSYAIYVAAKTHDLFRARSLMEKLRARGHVITYDWTQDVEVVGPDHQNEMAANKQFLREAAAKDIKGVRDCDLLIALSHPKSCGTIIEIGVAIGLKKPVYIVGRAMPYSVFWELPSISHAPDDEAILRLLHPDYRVAQKVDFV